MVGPHKNTVKTLALEERLAIVLNMDDEVQQLDPMLKLFSEEELRVIKTDLLQQPRFSEKKKRLEELLSLVEIARRRHRAGKAMSRMGQDL